MARSRRRGGRGRSGRSAPPSRPPRRPFWSWLRGLFTPVPRAQRPLPQNTPPSDAESRVIADFCRQFRLEFKRPDLLKLALTHRSYLSVTGQSARESNERLEFLGDSVLGLVTSEFLYREHPTEHEGQLTKTKSLLVSKAILSRRALAMGIGKYVLMSRSESDSGGRQRLSILADAFESIIGAIYLDQGFEVSRQFIMTYLLRDSREIVSDKRHTNYKSHLQEYVQSTFRTHPVYRIRSEVGPDHSKQFNVEVLVGRRVLGTGRGHNKKDAEQAAARDALAQAEGGPRSEPVRRESEPARPSREAREPRDAREPREAPEPRDAREPRRREDADDDERDEGRPGRRGRRGGRGRGEREAEPVAAEPRRDERAAAPPAREPAPPPRRVLDAGSIARIDADTDEEGRPEGLLEARRVDPFAWEDAAPPAPPARPATGGRSVERLRTWTPDVADEPPARDAGRGAAPPRAPVAPEPPREYVAPEPERGQATEPPRDERAWERDDTPRRDAPRDGAAEPDDLHDEAPPVGDESRPAPAEDERSARPAYGRRRARR